MKKIIEKLLAFYAKKLLKKYKPKIIGITGTVGKSSTKEAIYQVLKHNFSVRRNLKNYNNEIGLPLTILGRLSPGRSFPGWLRVFWMASGDSIFTSISYPKILVLEMAADHPGDINYLTKIAQPEIAVLTRIGPAHLEFFKTLENVTKEKFSLIKSLPLNGWAVLNIDDNIIREFIPEVKSKILTYGLSEKADVRALKISLEQEKPVKGKRPNVIGLRFKICYQGNIIPVFLPKVISENEVYASLAAASVGLIFDLHLIEIAEYLEKNIKPLSGRMRQIKGIKNTLIIDDTYNSSPLAVKSALDSLKKIEIYPEARKWIVLGDMLELGRYKVKEHLDIGNIIPKYKFDYLITFGDLAENIAKGAIENGMSKNKVLSYKDRKSLIKYLQDNIKPGDLILVKGSQGMRMEKIVKEIMELPKKAKNLLVRQEKRWQII